MSPSSKVAENQFLLFRTLDDARCGNHGRATTCARLTLACVDAGSVVAMAVPQKSSVNQLPTSIIESAGEP